MAQRFKGRRRLVHGPIAIDLVDEEAAMRVAGEAVLFAFALLEEDERHHVLNDTQDEIAFGPWLTGGRPSARTIRDRFHAAVAGVIRDRLSGEWQARGQYSNVKSLAGMAHVDRTKLLAGFAARAALVPALASAYLAARGLLPPLAEFMPYVDGAPVSDDAQAYGIHKDDGRRALSRLTGIAALGGDALVPLTCGPLVAGLRDDPRHPKSDPSRIARAKMELLRCGLSLDSSVPEHIRSHLTILVAARRVLETATAVGSPVCARAAVDPRQVLDQGLPKWLACGPLAYGPAAELGIAQHTFVPGTECGLLAAVSDARFGGLLTAFDSRMMETPEVSSRLAAIVYSTAGAKFTGPQLAESLCGAMRYRAVPGLKEIPPEVLTALGELPETDAFGMRIEAEDVAYLTLSHGVEVLDGLGQSHHAGMLIRTSPTLGIHAWTTNVDLRRQGAVGRVVPRAELQYRTALDSARADCLPRFFREFAVHQVKAGHLGTRASLRILAMTANAILVGVGRAIQAA